MFDPFGDYETAGYLRNVEKLKDLEEVKVQEHVFFEAHLEEALEFLQKKRRALAYEDFLAVHGILFGEFYPWAGKDRHQLGVGRLVGKGDRVQFVASEECRRAAEWALEMGNDKTVMRKKPGEVMGAFAWSHPFLDGNGRAMLLVHTELCHRAGFAIKWRDSPKAKYLEALTIELEHPQQGRLTSYFHPLIETRRTRADWIRDIKGLPGLDGADAGDANVVYADEDESALRRYDEFKRKRAGTPAKASGRR